MTRKVMHNLMVAVYDLETVFQLTQGNAALFYYKSKLNAFNFTVAYIQKQTGYCFLWRECNAHHGRGLKL